MFLKSAVYIANAALRISHRPALLSLLVLSAASLAVPASYAAPLAAPAAYADSLNEISIVLHPAIVQQVGDDGLLATASALVQRFGLGKALRREKSGAVSFALPPGITVDAARELVHDVERLRLVVAARIMPSPQTRHQLELQRSFEKSATVASVVGLIVKYRIPALVELSRANGTLPIVELQRLQEILGMALSGSRAMSGDAFVIYLAQAVNSTTAIAMTHQLELDPAIVYVSPDEIVRVQMTPNDTYFRQQWSLMGPPGGIEATRAWDITTGSPGGVVATVDTGILGHPEFGNRIIGGYDFVSNPAMAGDGDGRDPDFTDAGSWAPANYCYPGSLAQSSEWHGTHVAGIIAATGNNGIGIAGLDWQTKIVAARALGKCGGTTSDIVDGMRWAAGLYVPGVPPNPNPARVINMSVGGPTPCWLNPAEQEAALEMLVKGAAVVVSAGNDTANATNYSPAGCFGVITVGATGPSGDRASYSNYSNLVLDLSAPGGDSRVFGANAGILSTWATGTQSDPGQATYTPLDGTSMAAPHVSGTVSLMLAANPQLTVAQIHDLLTVTARPFPAGSTCARFQICGAGLLNTGDAVVAARDLVGVQWDFTDHWYNPQESGWGIQVTAQGNMQFVTWYTYGADGYPLWFTMLLTRQGQDIFSGDVYVTTGVPFPSINGQHSSTSNTKVGTATLFYYDFNDAALIYTVSNQTAVKPLQRLQFGSPLTICLYDTASRSSDTNYQDLWWNPAESGWGINLTHQGNTIFATWFTYIDQGRPIWFYMVANRTALNQFSGRFNGTTGVPYFQINGSQALQQNTDIGSGTLTFLDGEHARFDYNVLGTSGSKMIQRQVFASPVTHCQPVQ